MTLEPESRPESERIVHLRRVIGWPPGDWVSAGDSRLLADIDAALEQLQQFSRSKDANIERNEQGDIVEIRYASGAKRTFSYDESGRLVKAEMRQVHSDGHGKETRRVWSSAGLRWQRSDADGRQIGDPIECALGLDNNGTLVFFNSETEARGKIFLESAGGKRLLANRDDEGGKRTFREVNDGLEAVAACADRTKMWASIWNIAQIAGATVVGYVLLLALGGVPGTALSVAWLLGAPFILIGWGFDESGATQFFLLMVIEFIAALVVVGACVGLGRSLPFAAGAAMASVGLANLAILARAKEDRRKLAMALLLGIAAIGVLEMGKHWN